MKKISPLLCLFFSLITAVEYNPEFVVIVPTYNNEKLVEKNLDSIVNQDYPFFEVICINDCSKDQTGMLIDNYRAQHNLAHKLRVIHNSSNKGAMHNWYTTIHTLPKHKIVVCVDGDDRLGYNEHGEYNPHVLSELADVYRTKKIWMTYGNYTCKPAHACSICLPYSKSIYDKGTFRKYQFISSHLRTFYAGLFQFIKKEDFLYNGTFFQVCCDVAMMFPMLEMSADGHVKFIDKVIYEYNGENPLSDFRVRAKKIAKFHKFIAKKQPYEKLKKLDFLEI